MDKLQIPKLEFYITNMCNFGCTNCNRFNNLNFRGHQRWDEYANTIQEWSEYVDIQQVAIMGGEPLLNPTIVDWVRGIRKSWPKTHMQILTNGTQLNKVKGLYRAMCDSRVWLGVSLHNLDDFEEIDASIRDFYGNDFVKEEQSEKRDAGGIGADWYYEQDWKRSRFAGVWTQNAFYNSAIKSNNNDGTLTLHDSNPTLAHNNCTMREFKNYHMIEGKIYKCGPVALFPKLDEQFGIQLSDEDRNMMNSYQPLTIEMARAGEAQDWFNHIDDEIPQCKFCPESYDWVEVISTDDLYKKISKRNR